MCMFALTVSKAEPKNTKEEMVDHAWIKAMQEKIHQFDRRGVWELVDKPFGITVIGRRHRFEESFAPVSRLEAVAFRTSILVLRLLIVPDSHLAKVLINGPPSYGVKMECGLRQGLEVTIAKSRLNERRISWVKFKSIILDEELGGLLVGFLRFKNLGLLGKWKWRFLNEEKALWRVAINEFYGPDGGFEVASDGSAIGGIWADILKVVTQTEDIDVSIKDSFILKVANGSSTSYWKDHYCGEDSRLMCLFPRLFALGSFNDFKIKDRWHLVRKLVMTFSFS
nr:RNA-directed DNA polymerase, eukaryota, reverse transcriptase zinc-binding domain protein [Tanacetum cinerariifolium]